MTNHPQKILIVGPAWVGDMVMAQSLFTLLKQQNHQNEIHVIAPAWSLPLLERMLEITRVISLPIAHGQLALKQRYRLGIALRAERYDLAITLPNSWKSALIPLIASIPTRRGWLGEMRWGLLNDVRYLVKSNYPLMVQRFLALALPKDATLPTDFPRPKLITSEKTQQHVLQKFKLTLDKPILAMCPGAEFGNAKRWPAKNFADIAKEKIKQGWNVWILGSEKDGAAAQEIMQLTHEQCCNLTGKTTLVDTIDLLAQANIAVSNDSGLMHIAAAVDTPLLVIYGPTSEDFTPPLSANVKIVRSNLPCQPCFKRECPLKHHQCMTSIAPKEILTYIEEQTTCMS